MGKGVKYLYVLAAAYILGFAGALAVSNLNSFANILAFSFGYIFLFTIHAFSLSKTNPHIKKRMVAKEGGDSLVYVMAALGAVTLIVAALEYRLTGETLAHGFNFVGYGLILIGHFLAQSTLNAKPLHAMERYGEDLEGKEGGPYDIIRHPMALVYACMVLSVPLLFCVTYAFIPAGAGLIACFVWVAIKDQWRFVNYDWYYDYTKKVSYRFIPFIW